MTSQLSPIIEAVPFIGIDSAGRPVKPHPNFLRWFTTEVQLRVGGTQASTNIELMEDIGGVDQQLSDVLNQIGSFPSPIPPDPQADPDGRLEYLLSAVAQLACEIQALKQGTVL